MRDFQPGFRDTMDDRDILSCTYLIRSRMFVVEGRRITQILKMNRNATEFGQSWVRMNHINIILL